MPRIIIDYDPPFDGARQIEGDSSDLVYFLSWAFSARYGANHDLALLSTTLRNDFGIDLKALLTFADREVEEPADEEQLQRAWQDAAPLAAVCTDVAKALESDHDRVRQMRTDYPVLRDNIAELGGLASSADERASRIRVTFELA